MKNLLKEAFIRRVDRIETEKDINRIFDGYCVEIIAGDIECIASDEDYDYNSGCYNNSCIQCWTNYLLENQEARFEF